VRRQYMRTVSYYGDWVKLVDSFLAGFGFLHPAHNYQGFDEYMEQAYQLPEARARGGEEMMTDESVLVWASGWLRENTSEDPSFRQRFIDGLANELTARRADECAHIVAWLYSKDARRYTETGPLIAKALLEGRHRDRVPNKYAGAKPIDGEPVCALCNTPAGLHDDETCSFGFTPPEQAGGREKR
jgi:hypothetical protein